MIQITKPTIGMRSRMIHHHGRPTIFRMIRVFQIGMIAFHPASPAFWNIIQRPAIEST